MLNDVLKAMKEKKEELDLKKRDSPSPMDEKEEEDPMYCEECFKEKEKHKLKCDIKFTMDGMTLVAKCKDKEECKREIERRKEKQKKEGFTINDHSVGNCAFTFG
jgi:hypothetical protein